MTSHSTQGPVATLLALVLTASFALTAIGTPAAQPKAERVHAAATALVLM